MKLRPLLLISLPGLLAACTPRPVEPPATEPPAAVLPDSVQELTPEEAAKWIANHPGGIILDARKEGEFQQERIAGARLYDHLHGTDNLRRLDKLDREGHYLIYCAIGGRARLTAAAMVGMGFKHLSLIQGGLNAWAAAGKPVEGGGQ